MFSKVFAAAVLALTFTAQVHAHAAIAPVLGVAGTPKRSDVERPRGAKACGNTNIAANLDTSTPVVAAADGSFTTTITNFNGGKDGSRQVTMSVDAAATGKNFVAGTVSKNGDPAPASTGSEQITASLPAGTTCTGGTAGNLCLASFKTSGGFGNCVVVQQDAAAAGGATAGNATGSAAAGNVTGSAAAGNATGSAAAGGAAGGAAAGNAAGGATTGKATKGAAAGNAAGGTTAGGAAGGAAAGNAAGGATTGKATKGAAAGNAAGGAAAGSATGGAAAGNAATGGAAAGNAAAGNAAAGTDATGNGATRKEKLAQAAKALLGKNAGTRAPRALRAEMEVREEEAVRMSKRGVLSWMWV